MRRQLRGVRPPYELCKNNALNFITLGNTPTEQIAEWIHPAGYFNQKEGYIKGMVKTIRTQFDGSLTRLFTLDTSTLRKELLSWKGAGPETADSILLYAAQRPVFVVDAYTRRFLSRHGWATEKAAYDSIAKTFADALPEDVQLYNEYPALIVRLGKEYCKTTPSCAGCPLERFFAKEQVRLFVRNEARCLIYIESNSPSVAVFQPGCSNRCSRIMAEATAS
jgi:endonuclease III-like uncharacterized protein